MKDIITNRARELRKTQTLAENIFWNEVRAKRFEGKKFLRQYPMKFIIEGQERFFIADFFCAEYKLVVELDGKIHDKQKDYDELRDFIMKSCNISVLRFTNDEIEKDIVSVLNKIRQQIFFLPPFCPREGRGE